ncbi:MAG: hypothetical protein AB1810_06730 [Pseudomonadota bacterium]
MPHPSSIKALVFFLLSFVAGGAGAVTGKIAAGESHTLFVDGSAAYGMGSGAQGQLGKLNAKRRNPTPVALGITEVRHVVAGANTSVFIKKDGSAVFLGHNFGTGKAEFTPITIPLNDVRDVAVADSGLLVVAGGNLYRWDMVARHEPEQIKLYNIKQVAAGDGYAMALDASGNVFTWGSNRFGQLGDASYLDSIEPRLVATGIKSITAGRLHAVVINQNGEGLAWGNGTNGKLGDGSGLEAPFAVKVKGPALKSISAGEVNTVAVTSDGGLLAWGEHHYKSSDTLLMSFVPQSIGELKNVREASTAAGHVVVLTNDGELFTWGANDRGQLGLPGKAKASFAPVPVHKLTIEEAGM